MGIFHDCCICLGELHVVGSGGKGRNSQRFFKKLARSNVDTLVLHDNRRPNGCCMRPTGHSSTSVVRCCLTPQSQKRIVAQNNCTARPPGEAVRGHRPGLTRAADRFQPPYTPSPALYSVPLCCKIWRQIILSTPMVARSV